MKMLKGITWNHPRGYQPLRAAVPEWRRFNGNVDLTWDIRSLKDFGDYPVEKLCETYDLILVDHPFMGEAGAGKLLLPLDKSLPEDFIRKQKEESIGQSFASYHYNDHLLALPIDAAAQVAAYRKDLMDRYSLSAPTTLDELESMYEQVPKGKYVGIPLCPTDIWCTFLTLSAQYSNGTFFTENGIDSETGVQALDTIRKWIPYIHPRSLDINPIQMLDFMSTSDEVVYVPFIFSYSNYSRQQFDGKAITFGNVPVAGPDTPSAILGGVGIAISAQSRNKEEALSFIRFILSEDIQKGLYYREGGQPAHNSAWIDKTVNKDCNNYFLNIRKTLDDAWVRPRVKGFNRFQEQAADHLNASVKKGDASKRTIEDINKLFGELCGDRQLKK